MELKLDSVRLANMPARENKAITYSRKCRKAKERREITLLFFVVFLLMFALGKISANATEKLQNKYAGYDYQQTMAELEKETETQPYIVRYGTTEDWGSTIVTEDGNVWNLEDCPEYENKTEVRVLFDSKGTSKVEDDEIIDVTER